MSRTPTERRERRTVSVPFLRWIDRLWLGRRLSAKRYAARLASQSVPAIICRVFGSYCSQAVAVARCESGLSTTAVNGQYLGIFQMGSSERAIYGGGGTALEQAQAAYRYFVASGRDWSPWSCKP